MRTQESNGYHSKIPGCFHGYQYILGSPAGGKTNQNILGFPKSLNLPNEDLLESKIITGSS
jgi:hypothetical protein